MNCAQKKTLEHLPSKGYRRSTLNDSASPRYEALRREFLRLGHTGAGEDWVRFYALGFAGLLPSQPGADTVVEVYDAPVRRWWGRIDPKEHALLEAFRLLSADAPFSHSSF